MRRTGNEAGMEEGGVKDIVWFGKLAKNKSLEHLVVLLRITLKWV
jgi:hypothetical protein